MGWSNSTFQLLIVVAAPSGFSGLFVYSPAPGTGNLLLAIAAADGTDPYGNGYFRCLTIINDTTNGISLLTGRPAGVEAHNAFLGTFSQNTGLANEILSLIIDSAAIAAGHGDRSKVALFSSALDGSSPANGFLYWVDTAGASHSALQWNLGGITAIGSIAAQQPGVTSPPTAEVWHSFTGLLQNSWTQSGTLPVRYRKTAEGNMLFDFYVVIPAGGLVANQVIASGFPAAYTPPYNAPALTGWDVGTGISAMIPLRFYYNPFNELHFAGPTPAGTAAGDIVAVTMQLVPLS